MMPEQQQRILGYFIEEAKDHLNTIEQGLLNLQATIQDPEMVSEVFRAAHSVKGGAAMLSLGSIQKTSHRLEDYFKLLKEAPTTQVDRDLESMFLQVFDALQALLEELQGPFGLTEEKAQEVMADVDPVFGQIETHLEKLIAAAPGAAPAATPQTTSQGTSSQRVVVASSREDSALRLVFSSDVPGHLREMLAVFKQADTPNSRTTLQITCDALNRIGEQFDLNLWCELTEATRQAVGNPEQTFRSLAPVVIKELKRAQELVLSGQANAIAVSSELESLMPIPTEPEAMGDIDSLIDDALSATEEPDLADLFESEAAQAPEEGDFDLLDLSTDSDGDAVADDGLDLSLDLTEEGSPPEGRREPTVGAAELNSLADLFEGEVSELDSPWEEISENEAAIAENAGPDINLSEDFSDLLDDSLDDENADASDDLADLFGDTAIIDNSSFAASESENGEDDLNDLLRTGRDESVPAAADADESGLDALLDGLEASDEDNEFDFGEIADTASPFDGVQAEEVDLDSAAEDSFLDLDLESTDTVEADEDFDLDFEAIAPDAEADSPAAESGDFDQLFGAETTIEAPATLDDAVNPEAAAIAEAVDTAAFEAIEDPWSTHAEEDTSDESALDALDELWAENTPEEETTDHNDLDDDLDLGDLDLNAEAAEVTQSASGVSEDLSFLETSDETPDADDWGDLLTAEDDNVDDPELTSPEAEHSDPMAESSDFDLDLDLWTSESETDGSPSLESATETSAEATADPLDNDLSGLFDEAPAAETGLEDEDFGFADLGDETSDAESIFDDSDTATDTQIQDFDDFLLSDEEEAEDFSGELSGPSDGTAHDLDDHSDSNATSPEEMVVDDLNGFMEAADESSAESLAIPLSAGDADSFDIDLTFGEEEDENLSLEDSSEPFDDLLDNSAPDLDLPGEDENLGTEDFFETENDAAAGSPVGDTSGEDFFDAIAAPDASTDSEPSTTNSAAESEIDDFFDAPASEVAPFHEEPGELTQEDLMSSEAIADVDDAGLEDGDLDLEMDLSDAALDGSDVDGDAIAAADETSADDLFEEDTFSELDQQASTAGADFSGLEESSDTFAADSGDEDSEFEGLLDDSLSVMDEAIDLEDMEAPLPDASAPGDASEAATTEDDLELDFGELEGFGEVDAPDAPTSLEMDEDSEEIAEGFAMETSDDSGLENSAITEDLDLDFGELDGFNEETTDPFAFSETAADMDEGADLADGESAFDELDALLEDAPTAEPPPSDGAVNNEDVDFGELEDLLNDDAPVTQADSGAEGSDVDFSELDALIGDDGDASVSNGAIASDSSDDDFGDLEKLLEEADQTLGGSASTIRTAGPGRSPRRVGGIVDQTMRVSVKHLDNLNNLVGELVVNRNSLEQDQERFRQFLDNLLFQVQQLNDVGQRMRDLYERSLLESSLLASRQAIHAGGSRLTGHGENGDSHATGANFDALEMDRFTGFHTLTQEMIELIVRVRESSSDIAYTVESTDQIARQFRQVTTQLQEGLNKARMVPFAQTADRLPRAVRDISIKCGKEARLVVEGRDTLIDKMLLERLYDPMTHLVNNAITHGVEAPEERVAIGKSREGKILVRAFYQGNQTVIFIQDDGGGIDADVVKRKAIQKGLITRSEADSMNTVETYELLFRHGFSTRDQADDFAGRGVGMDVVRTALSEIRGSISIDSELGKGTSFTIRLPLTLSISKALSCLNNQARIAFPMDGVEDMFDVPKDRVQTDAEGHTYIQWRDMALTFQPLSDLLHFNRSLGRGRVYGGSQDDDMVSIVVLRNANTYIGIQVDRVLGEQEIVIKQIEGPVPKPMGIAGATVLGDGRVMPIADVLELIDIAQGRVRREAGSSLWSQVEQPPEDQEPVKTEPTVLIVDDSITVRELLSMSFNKVGYRVEQARDGQEAWEKMRSGLPCDLVFCDIEMPRMDGLELLSRMQKDAMLKQIPIAMLTSRGADRHRQMALDLGASGYFTKPYLEEALLEAAQKMLNGEVLLAVTAEPEE